jgi:HD-like signal output (HDOD) protein
MFKRLARWFSGRAKSQARPIPPRKQAPEQSAPEETHRGGDVHPPFNAQEEFLRILFGITATDQEQPLTPWENTLVQEIEHTLALRDRLTEQVPRFPTIIPQLMSAMRHDEFSGKQFAELIERDPTLTGEVLSLVNSPFFRIKREKIQSLQEAILILGQNGLREAIASAAFKPIMRFESRLFDRAYVMKLWEQSTNCAALCRCQASTILGLDPFEAFLAGLMRNIGLIVAIRIVNRVDDASSIPETRLFLDRLSDQVSRLSAAVADGWGLPEAVIAALKEQSSVQTPASMSNFGQILFVSAALACTRNLIEEHDYPSEMVDALFASDLPLTRKSRDCYARLG